MIISIASGKGGTGKTTIAASLASVIKDSVYVDLDVEEPNGHLLLNPEFTSINEAYKFLPLIDQDKCTYCGKCVEVCEFNALVNLKFEILLFDEMCHGCGACTYFCPENAITEQKKSIGLVRCGVTNSNIFFIDGILKIGEVAAAPLIKEVKKKVLRNKINILDSPPGTSCSMVEAVKDSNFCLLVTESTPFGFNDLKLAIDVLKEVNIDFAVLINKYNENFYEMENYLNENGIDVLLKIPFERKYAEAYSEGTLPVIKFPSLRKDFEDLFKKILERTEKINAE